jgi:hypothetical protein
MWRVVVVALLLTGCATADQMQDRCATARSVLAAYDAANAAAEHVPTKNEVIAAAAARVLVETSCER